MPDVALAQILIFESKKASQIYELLAVKFSNLFMSVLEDPEHPETGLVKIPKENTHITITWNGIGTQRKIQVEIEDNGKKTYLGAEFDRELFNYIRLVKKII